MFVLFFSSPTEACHGLTVSNGPPGFNGVYHKLPDLKNNHYQWESRFAGHLGDYVLYFDTATENTWVIKGTSGPVVVLKGLEHFFETFDNSRSSNLWRKNLQ